MKENKRLEFKSDINNSFLKTVSAFANYHDGEILFGVDDNGIEIGIANINQTCLDIENKINDSIKPKPDYEFKLESNNIIKLIVHKGSFTPYLYKGKAYRRADTSSVEVDEHALKLLVLDGLNISFESLVYKEHNLTFNYLEDKLKQSLNIDTINENILRTLGFMTTNEDYTNAGALFADHNSFFGIDIAKFDDSISNIQEREQFTNECILKQYQEAISFYRRYYQYEVIEDDTRKTIELLPEVAFREALVNALVHRDWSLKSYIRILMFPDHIEIKSPGNLPAGITMEEYLEGDISYLRNPLVANIFYRLKYIEMFGTGIRRIKERYKDSAAKPSFKSTENVLTVILPTISRHYDVNADEELVLKILSNKMALSSSEIAQQSGFSKAKIIRILNSLESKNYIDRIGQARSTRYKKNI